MLGNGVFWVLGVGVFALELDLADLKFFDFGQKEFIRDRLTFLDDA